MTIAMLQETHSARDPNFAGMDCFNSRGQYSNNTELKGGVATLLMGKYYHANVVKKKECAIHFDTIAIARYLFDNVMVTTVNVYFPPKTTVVMRRLIIQQLEHVEA